MESEMFLAIKTYKDGTLFTGVVGHSTEELSLASPAPPRSPVGTSKKMVPATARSSDFNLRSDPQLK
jgi:hypothetical protein